MSMSNIPKKYFICIQKYHYDKNLYSLTKNMANINLFSTNEWGHYEYGFRE